MIYNFSQEDIERGKWIRMLREQLGLTQEGLAGELGVSSNTVYGWEKGRRISVKNKYRLCQVLHVSSVVLDGNPSNLINAQEFQMTYLKRLGLCSDCQRKIEEAIHSYYKENGSL